MVSMAVLGLFTHVRPLMTMSKTPGEAVQAIAQRLSSSRGRLTLLNGLATLSWAEPSSLLGSASNITYPGLRPMKV
jgi:hypothetical protein